MYGRICSGPSAQLMPTLSRSAWAIEVQKASTVWADSVRPPSKDGERGHHRQPHVVICEVLVDGEQAGLEHQRVERGLRQQDVDARLDQRRHLLVVRLDHLRRTSRRDARDRRRCRPSTAACLVGPIEPATNRGRSGVRRFISSTARRASGDRRQVHFADMVRQREVGHRDRVGIERVGLDDVGAGLEVIADGSFRSPRAA